MLPPSKLQFNGADIWFGGEQTTAAHMRPIRSGSLAPATCIGADGLSKGSGTAVAVGSSDTDLDEARRMVRRFIQSKTRAS